MLGDLSSFEAELGGAWGDTTTFAEWHYRMLARQIVHPLFLALLGGVNGPAVHTYVSSVKSLPLPVRKRCLSVSVLLCQLHA